MGLNNQGGYICRIRPIGAHRSRSPARDRKSPRTRGDLDGDHGNCRRISLWNFGREQQIRTALRSHANPKTLRVCVFFRTILRKSRIGETGVWREGDLNRRDPSFRGVVPRFEGHFDSLEGTRLG